MKKLYPWTKWFDKAMCSRKHTFCIMRGKHFHCSSVSMAQQIRNAASARNLQISIIETSTGFAVRVHQGIASAQDQSLCSFAGPSS